MPFSRGERGGRGENVVLAHPQNDVIAVEREISRKFFLGISKTCDQARVSSSASAGFTQA